MNTTRAIGLAVVFCAVVACCCGPVSAQPAPPNITVTPKPVGSGARALGQSAFIAVADDATAASWNPAGLIQLEHPEASIVGAWAHSTDHFSSSSRDLLIGKEDWSFPEINFASIALPLALGEKDVVASLNYHQVYDFGFDASYHQIFRGTIPPIVLLPRKVDVESQGGVAATSLAAGLSLTPSVTVGAAVNLYHNNLYSGETWQVRTKASGQGTIGGVIPLSYNYDDTETYDDFQGCNLTFGALWDVWQKEEKRLTLGLVVHTPYTASLTRETRTTRVLNGVVARNAMRQRLDMDFPLSVGAGANYRISDAWSVACDVQWTDWSKFEQKNRFGVRSSPLGGGPVGEVADTLAVRAGTEYLFFLEDSVFAMRAGVFHEPRPALGDSMGVFGCSLGGGWTTRRFSLDVAYQYRVGEEVSGRNLGLGGVTKFDVEEHWLVTSLIIYLP